MSWKHPFGREQGPPKQRESSLNVSSALERPPRVWQAAAQPAFCVRVLLMDRRPGPGTQLPERDAVGKGDVAKSSPNLDVKDTHGGGCGEGRVH